MFQSKDLGWGNGQKNKNHVYGTYKRLASDLKTMTKIEIKEKILHADRNKKKAEVAMLISNKREFKTKSVTRDREGYHRMLKGSIQ